MSYITKVQHKYQVGDKVLVTNNCFKWAIGEITALMPWALVVPAYYVRINGMVAAVSERSIQSCLTAKQREYIKLFLAGECTDGYLMTRLGIFPWSKAMEMINQYRREEGNV